MKKIILIFIIYSSLFSQDVLITIKGNKYTGRMIKQEKEHVVFLVKGKKIENKVPILSIATIILENGKRLEFSNDILITTKGDELRGSWLSTREEHVSFIKKGDTNASLIPKNTIKSITLTRGGVVDLSIITYKMSEEELDEHLLKQKCDENKQLRVLVIPIKDDIYGISPMIEENYDSLCYNVVKNISALEYFHKENISLDEINDYHLINAGQAVSANIVIYGYAYTFNVPYKYSPISSDPLAVTTLWETDYDSPWNTLFKSLTRTMVIGGQKSKRGQAISAAGSYVNLTYFTLNIDTGKKIFILKNKTIMKVG